MNEYTERITASRASEHVTLGDTTDIYIYLLIIIIIIIIITVRHNISALRCHAVSYSGDILYATHTTPVRQYKPDEHRTTALLSTATVRTAKTIHKTHVTWPHRQTVQLPCFLLPAGVGRVDHASGVREADSTQPPWRTAGHSQWLAEGLWPVQVRIRGGLNAGLQRLQQRRHLWLSGCAGRLHTGIWNCRHCLAQSLPPSHQQQVGDRRRLSAWMTAMNRVTGLQEGPVRTAQWTHTVSVINDN